jgi:CheY-like chemotaxis protein
MTTSPRAAPRILLVEDDPADSRLVQRAFDKAGVNATLMRLTNGDEAVSYLAGEPPYENRAAHPMPSLVLLDLKLPRRSGLEVLRWIRTRSDGLRRMPVIMLSSSRDALDVDRAYDYGANSYLAKPETARQLQDLAEAFNIYWLKFNEVPSFLGGGK